MDPTCQWHAMQPVTMISLTLYGTGRAWGVDELRRLRPRHRHPVSTGGRTYLLPLELWVGRAGLTDGQSALCALDAIRPMHGESPLLRPRHRVHTHPLPPARLISTPDVPGRMKLSKGAIIGLVVLAVIIIAVLVFVAWAISSYNGMVNENEKIDSQWAQVTNQYQRKIDLIPTLVATVREYKEFENSTLTNITALRSRWMNASSAEDQVNASNELDKAMVYIHVTYEAYPVLQSDELFKSLMTELAGTENRITVERMRYNEAVKDYNAHIKRFPASMVAGWGDFEERSYYVSPNAEAEPGS